LALAKLPTIRARPFTVSPSLQDWQGHLVSEYAKTIFE
jgi:hypothetical protein